VRRSILPILSVALLLALLPAPASADPDEETLEAELADAIEAIAEAEDAVKAAKKRAKELEAAITETTELLDGLTDDLNDYAVYLHTEGDLVTTAAVLSAPTPEHMVDAMTFTGYLADQRASLVQNASDLLAQLEAEQAAHADEVAAAAELLAEAEALAEDLEDELKILRFQNAGGPSSDGGARAPPPPPPHNPPGPPPPTPPAPPTTWQS
jgi:peptidoglycan DL-endopeptidase CwlO